jgi:hypothetical protein
VYGNKGQEIGSGNFGRVVKAEAVGLKDADENVTTVAVKMDKPTAKFGRRSSIASFD